MLYTLKTQRQMALTAGWSLILMALASGFSYGYAFPRSGLLQEGSQPLPATGGSWLRYGIAGFVLVLLLDILVAWSLYFFLRPVNRQLSLLSSWLRLVYAALFGAAQYHLLFLLGLSEAGSPLATATLHLHFNIFREMWSLSLIILSCHLAVLGWLVIRSGYIPKVCGILAVVAAICYIVCSFLQLLWVGYDYYRATVEEFLAAPMAAGELALAFWLVFRGGKKKSIIVAT